MILRNTAGQAVLLGPLTKTDGTAETTGATISTRIGGVTAAGAGVLTHVSGGVWEYAPTQAETDTPVLGLVLEKAGAISVPLTVPTTRFPAQTKGVLPSVAAGEAAGLPLASNVPSASDVAAAVGTRIPAARNLTGVTAPTFDDCLLAAAAHAAGPEVLDNTAYTRKHLNGTTMRLFTLDDPAVPTTRD